MSERIGELFNPSRGEKLSKIAPQFCNTLYIDGQLVAVRVESARNSDSAASLFIGAQAISVAPFDGIVDEVEIFNRALSQAKIQAIFNAGSAGKCKGCAITPTVTSQIVNNGR